MADDDKTLQDQNGQDSDNGDPNKDLDPGKNPEDKNGQDDSGKGDAGKGSDDNKDDLSTQLDARDHEIQELRSLLRENRQELNGLHETVNGSIEAMDKAGIIPEEDKNATKQEEALVAQREHELDILLEMTRLNPKFEDVDTVVSQGNFDKAIDVLAKDYSRVNAVSMNEATQAVEGWVWSKTNPYTYMYNYIKKMDTSSGAAKVKPAKAPGSIENLSGGSNEGGAWTAAKIDNLPEDQLSKVPKDIYDAYLKNELK